MRRHLLLLGTIVLSLSIITLAYFYAKKKGVLPGGEKVELEVASEFALPNSDGEITKLSDIKGKVKVVNFWASWSPYSKDELKYLNEIKNEFGEDIAVVAVSRDHNIDEGKRFLVDNNIEDNLIFVFDKEDEYYKLMSGYAVPETVFLNKKDEIIEHIHRPMEKDEFIEEINNVLN